MSDPLLQKALAAKRESWRFEFKESATFSSAQDACELIKDLIAIANSSGGVILFGVNNRGAPTGVDLSEIRTLDPARVSDCIRKYTGTDFADFEMQEPEKDGQRLVAWVIGPSPTPIVFVQPGTYAVPGGKQKTAFSRGSVYFRHGAKSEPGTTADIEAALNRKLESVRKEWLRGVSQVVHAPPGAEVTVAPASVRQSSSPDAAPIRITDDPTAPAYQLIDPDKTHPFRQRELIAEVRKLVPPATVFNQYDVQAIRRVYGIDAKPEYAHKPKFGSYQFSPAFRDWVTTQVVSDREFLSKVRSKHRDGG